MSAKIIKKIVIDVTNGDVVTKNKEIKMDGTKHKSNTGTYFLCSKKQEQNFLCFTNHTSKLNYFIDIEKVYDYYLVFNNLYKGDKDYYLDKMINFDNYYRDLMELSDNKIKGMETRVNDTRIFAKFSDNNEPAVYALRHMLYAGKSSLILELDDKDNCFIYPEVKKIKLELELV